MISPNFREAKINKIFACENFEKSLIFQKNDCLSSEDQENNLRSRLFFSCPARRAAAKARQGLCEPAALQGQALSCDSPHRKAPGAKSGPEGP